MNIDWKFLGTELLDNSLAVFATELIGLEDRVLMPNESEFVRYAKMGAIWEIVNELVLLVKFGSSHLLEGHYYILVDNVFFNSATWAFLDKSGMGARVTNAVDASLPFSNEINGAIATGVIKVSAQIFKSYVEKNWNNSPLGYLTSVTKMAGLQASEQGGVLQAFF